MPKQNIVNSVQRDLSQQWLGSVCVCSHASQSENWPHMFQELVLHFSSAPAASFGSASVQDSTLNHFLVEFDDRLGGEVVS